MEERWARLEEIVRRVVREELAGLKKKPQISFENGRFVGISEEQTIAWGAAYEGIDIAAELKKMAAWCVSNPHLAPKSQWGRFVNTWLVRHHNQASLRSIPVKSAPTLSEVKKCSYCSATSHGTTNGYHYCGLREHQHNAMDNVKPLGNVRNIA